MLVVFKADAVSDRSGHDAFLSHSHQDAEIVEALAKRLEDETGLRVWLDKWVLVPGERWRCAPLAAGIVPLANHLRPSRKARS
jgi:hypothetical protein